MRFSSRRRSAWSSSQGRLLAASTNTSSRPRDSPSICRAGGVRCIADSRGRATARCVAHWRRGWQLCPLPDLHPPPACRMPHAPALAAQSSRACWHPARPAPPGPPPSPSARVALLPTPTRTCTSSSVFMRLLASCSPSPPRAPMSASTSSRKMVLGAWWRASSNSTCGWGGGGRGGRGRQVVLGTWAAGQLNQRLHVVPQGEEGLRGEGSRRSGVHVCHLVAGGR